MAEKKYMSIEIKDFEIKEFEEDNRLAKVHLKLMHDGINANRSEILLKDLKRDFKKYVTNSIAGVPIVAGFSRNRRGENDFSGHDEDEQVLGIIEPKHCNAKFVYDKKYDRTFIEVDGYIYRYYSNGAVDILENAKDKKRACSVELEVLDGEVDETRDIFQIKSWKLLCVTLLSSDIPEGMKGSQVQLDFSEKAIDRIKELNESIERAFSDKSGVENNQINEKEEGEKTLKKSEIAKKFNLTANQLSDELWKACYNCKYKVVTESREYEYTKYWFRDYNEEFVYAYDSETGYLVGFNYEFEGDLPKVDFENPKRMKVVYELLVMSNDEGEDDDCEVEHFSMDKLIKENNELGEKVESLNTDLTKANEDFAKTSEDLVKANEDLTKVTGELETAKESTISLGEKFEAITAEKAEADSKIETLAQEISELKATEIQREIDGLIAEAQKTFEKTSSKFSKEEATELEELIKAIATKEDYAKFESKLKDLAFARFSNISTTPISTDRINIFESGVEPEAKKKEADKHIDIFAKWKAERDSE